MVQKGATWKEKTWKRLNKINTCLFVFLYPRLFKFYLKGNKEQLKVSHKSLNNQVFKN